MEEIAAHHEVSTGTVKRRIREARSEHGAGWGRPLVKAPPASAEPSAVIDVNDRSAVDALTKSVLIDVAAARGKDAVSAAKALRDSLKLDDAPITSEDAGGFSPQDAANLRSIQRLLGSLLQHAISNLIARLEAAPPEDTDTLELHTRVRDLYRAHAQPKCRPEVGEELVAALMQVGAAELYRDMPLLEALIT